jgi:hypothetical protein
MKTIDFARCIMGLHAYRTITHMQGRGFAEAFVLLPADAYRRVAATVLRRTSRGLHLTTKPM